MNSVRNFIRKNQRKIFLLFYVLYAPLSTLYAACDPSKQICDPLEERFGSVPELIKTILEGALIIGMPIVALAVIYCGFLFVFARGNPEKLTKAKDALLYTLIGAAILLGSWAIAKMIKITITGLSP